MSPFAASAFTLLLLAGCRSPTTSAPAPAPPSAGCEASPTDDVPPSSSSAERVAVDILVARKPRRGLFVSDGWAQQATHCNPCPAGATCKPCEEVVWLSPAFGDFKDPLVRDQNLVLAVPDARRFDLHGHYRVLIAACDAASTLPDAPLRAELRGFERLP